MSAVTGPELAAAAELLGISLVLQCMRTLLVCVFERGTRVINAGSAAIRTDAWASRPGTGGCNQLSATCVALVQTWRPVARARGQAGLGPSPPHPHPPNARCFCICPCAQEDDRLLRVARDMLHPDSLPAGWQVAFDAEQRTWCAPCAAGGCRCSPAISGGASIMPPARTLRRTYTHPATGQQRDRHPVWDYYVGVIFMECGGYAQLRENAEAAPPSPKEVRCTHGRRWVSCDCDCTCPGHSHAELSGRCSTRMHGDGGGQVHRLCVG
jgi:hypothetical protein